MGMNHSLRVKEMLSNLFSFLIMSLHDNNNNTL